jgi:hypothetical protein
MGSILVSRLFTDAGWAADAGRWRGDDLFRQIEDVFFSANPFQAADVVGVTASFCVGIVLALGTYAIGAAWAGGWQRIRSKPEPRFCP